ncbi:MAG TPA: RHS repeat-associated core domain-containing protein, partial [Jatrophihabitantaceae bacterium]|nr:RHS repeat-associated core domain-containing protein [Jatrophihabitantaceae bacterium]
GDIVATAADDPAATGIASYSETTEYGTPRDSASASDSYGWLGSKQRSTDDLAGLTLMGVRLYNPVTGRFLSVDPVPGGNANAYAYPVDPISGYDFDGRCSILCHIAHWANEIIDPTPQVMPNRTWEFLTHHIKAIAATAGIVACTFTGVAACLAISTVATLLANLKGGIRHNSRDLIQEELMNLGGAGAGERLEMMYERYSTRQWLQWVTNRLIPMEGVVAV